MAMKSTLRRGVEAPRIMLKLADAAPNMAARRVGWIACMEKPIYHHAIRDSLLSDHD